MKRVTVTMELAVPDDLRAADVEFALLGSMSDYGYGWRLTHRMQVEVVRQLTQDEINDFG